MLSLGPKAVELARSVKAPRAPRQQQLPQRQQPQPRPQPPTRCVRRSAVCAVCPESMWFPPGQNRGVRARAGQRSRRACIAPARRDDETACALPAMQRRGSRDLLPCVSYSAVRKRPTPSQRTAPAAMSAHAAGLAQLGALRSRVQRSTAGRKCSAAPAASRQAAASATSACHITNSSAHVLCARSARPRALRCASTAWLGVWRRSLFLPSQSVRRASRRGQRRSGAGLWRGGACALLAPCPHAVA